MYFQSFIVVFLEFILCFFINSRYSFCYKKGKFHIHFHQHKIRIMAQNEPSISTDDSSIETINSTIDTTTDSIVNHTIDSTMDSTIVSTEKCTTSSAEKVPTVKKTIKKRTASVIRKNWTRAAINSIVYPKLRALTPDSDEDNDLKWGSVDGVGNGE